MTTAAYPIRTQISLSPDLKGLIENEGEKLGESLSEYLRKAAIMRLAVESNRKRDLEMVAELVAGSVPKSKSGWKNVKNIAKWQHEVRKEEDEHRG